MTIKPATLSTATLNRADPRLDLVIGFRPMIAKGADRPFAWQAVASGADGRSFAAISASLLPELRPALEARRITLALERAAELGIHCGEALIAVPLGAAAGLAEPLLSHLFRAALANGIATDRLVVEISADERADFDQAAALAEACTRRGLSITLDAFAAGPVALKLLARFTPRFVKLDPSLVRGIDGSASRRLMADGVMRLARNMGVTVIARAETVHGRAPFPDRHRRHSAGRGRQARTPRRDAASASPPRPSQSRLSAPRRPRRDRSHHAGCVVALRR
jgi:predicted signal transduction protein with EAL and GGDEF domain